MRFPQAQEVCPCDNMLTSGSMLLRQDALPMVLSWLERDPSAGLPHIVHRLPSPPVHTNFVRLEIKLKFADSDSATRVPEDTLMC